MMFAAFRPGAASLHPEAAKLPKAFAPSSPLPAWYFLPQVQGAAADRGRLRHAGRNRYVGNCRVDSQFRKSARGFRVDELAWTEPWGELRVSESVYRLARRGGNVPRAIKGGPRAAAPRRGPREGNWGG